MKRSSKNILIVEDEHVLQLMLVHMLRRMGFEKFEKATKGREAVEHSNSHDFDLILMDIMLQDDIDGIEAYRQIKDKKGAIPVVYITGNTDPKNKERAKELGYYEYTGKPITEKQLQNFIDKIGPLNL